VLQGTCRIRSFFLTMCRIHFFDPKCFSYFVLHFLVILHSLVYRFLSSNGLRSPCGYLQTSPKTSLSCGGTLHLRQRQPLRLFHDLSIRFQFTLVCFSCEWGSGSRSESWASVNSQRDTISSCILFSYEST